MLIVLQTCLLQKLSVFVSHSFFYATWFKLCERNRKPYQLFSRLHEVYSSARSSPPAPRHPAGNMAVKKSPSPPALAVFVVFVRDSRSVNSAAGSWKKFSIKLQNTRKLCDAVRWSEKCWKATWRICVIRETTVYHELGCPDNMDRSGSIRETLM